MDINFFDKSIKTKIVIIVMVIFAFFITTSLIFSIYSLESRSRKEMEEFSKSERERTQESLKSYVHIAYTAVQNNYKNATDVKYLTDYYGERLNNQVDVAMKIIDEKVQLWRSGRMSKQQAQQQALDMISKMRYNHGVGYYFIFTREKPIPRMVIEPLSPELNGIILDDKRFNNASGTDKNWFVASLELLEGKTEAYIDYIWPRPGDKELMDTPKFSYLRVLEEWDWVIGTGIYLDDAVKDCVKKSIADLRQMRYANGAGYYWINDNTKPTPRLIMNPFLTESEGQILTDKKYNRAYGEDYNLYEAFLDACEETGEGLVEYSWDKPYKGTVIENAPKISYVKFFKPLGWVIGSGVYIDDIDRAISAKTAKMKEERTGLIINYLLISLTLAAISIGILVFLMNRFFEQKAPETALSIDENKTKQETNNEPNYDKHGLNNTVNSGISIPEPQPSEMGNLVGMILREQTKQLAMARMAEQELREKSETELRGILSELKEIINEVRSTPNHN